MPSLSAVLLFAAASVALLLVPGPSVLYVVTRSVSQGRRAGLVSVLGVHVGSLVHITAAAVGISALIAASATAFTLIKVLGAGYLIFVGFRKLTSRADDTPTAIRSESLMRIFRQGVIVNVLNPKTAMFFLAFLPQFVDPHRGPVTAQILVLGAVWVVLGVLSDGSYAVVSAGLVSRWRGSTAARHRVERGSGAVYVGLGVTLAAQAHT